MFHFIHFHNIPACYNGGFSSRKFINARLTHHVWSEGFLSAFTQWRNPLGIILLFSLNVLWLHKGPDAHFSIHVHLKKKKKNNNW